MRVFSFIYFVFFSLFLSLGTALAKPPPIDYYVKLPYTYDASISPDGKWLGVVIDNEGEYILRVINLANPADRKVRAAKYPKNVKVNWIKWANNEQLLLSTRQTFKRGGTIYNTGYLFVLDVDLSDAKQVLDSKIKSFGRTGSPNDIRQFNNVVVDFLPADPEHILMAFGRNDQFKPGVHMVSLKTRSKKIIKSGSSRIQHWVTDLRGEVRVGYGRADRSGDWFMTIRDAHSKKWRNVKEYTGIDADTKVVGFMSNPDEMIIAKYNGKDTLGLYVYNLATKSMGRKLFHNDNYDVQSIIISADGKKVIGATYLADTLVREFFDPIAKARMSKIENILKNYQISIIETTPDNKITLFKASAPDVPPALYFYDDSKGKVNILVSDYPDIENTPQAEVVKAKYTARDGFKIPAYVTIPNKVSNKKIPLKNLPFIILPHGGPYARDTHSFDYMAQLFASRGYAVLQMNFRGSEGYGKKFKEAGRENWEIMQEDVEDGVKWLIKKGYANPERICIVGWSYGGYAALMAAIKNPDLYACSASIAGVTDLQDMVADLKKYRFGKHAAKNFLLKGFDSKTDMKANSPVKRAGEIKIPVFLAHGTKDVIVHYDQYTRMKRALKKSKAKKTFVSLKDGDHSLLDNKLRLEMFGKLDKFLKDNLGASEAAP